MTASGDHQQAEGAAGGRGGGGVEQLADPVPEGVQGALDQAGVVLVVHRAWTARAGPPPARDRAGS